MATNFQLIEEAAMMVGFEFDGNNLKTFAEWKKLGYSVKKGEKATLQVELWKPFTKVATDEKGQTMIDEKTGEQKTESRFMLKLSHLFTSDQVKKMEAKKKKTTKKKAA